MKLHKAQKPLTAEKLTEMKARKTSEGFVMPSLATKSQSSKMPAGKLTRAIPTTSSETNNSTPQSSTEESMKKKVNQSCDSDQHTPPVVKSISSVDGVSACSYLFNSDYEEFTPLENFTNNFYPAFPT